MLDRERLAKILAMTTSDHDGEALSAMRKANEIIKGEGLTWALLLEQVGRTVTVTVSRQPPSQYYEPSDAWVPPHLHDKNTLDLIFRTIMAKVTPGTEAREFIDSVYSWYQKHGSVTPKQYAALRTFYSRASR